MIICKIAKTCERKHCKAKKPHLVKDWKPCPYVDEKYAYPIAFALTTCNKGIRYSGISAEVQIAMTGP